MRTRRNQPVKPWSNLSRTVLLALCGLTLAFGTGCRGPDLNDNGQNDNGENGNGENDNGQNDNGENDNGENDNGENDNGENDNGENDNGENDNGENGNGEDGDLDVTLHGRLERGEIIWAGLQHDGEEVPVGTAAWSASPDDAVLFLPDDQLQLLRATTVTLTAEVDELIGNAQVTVASPPTILFQHFVDRAWRLYSVELDGEELERVIEGDGREPASAGESIVFVSDREGRPAVYSLSAGASDPDRLTPLDTEHGQPALDESDSTLLFIRFVGGIPKIFIAERDGEDAQRLTVDFGTPLTVEGGPAFSPDGTEVVFSSSPGATPDLFIADVETGEVSALRSGSDFFLDSAWSPCGRYIAYSARPSDMQKLDLFLVDLDTDETQMLTDRDLADGQPAWLPDGRLLYFSEVGDTTELRWMDPADPGEVYTIPTGPERARGPVALH